MQPPKHIGIVAVSAEGAALCYRTICIEGEGLLGPYGHPEISLHSYPLNEYLAYIDAGRWEDVGRLMLTSAQTLARCGASFLICPDNTVHQALDLIRHGSPLPWLHIAEEVADAAAGRKYGRVGILGTRWLMASPVYPTKLAARGIECSFPEPDEQSRIHTIIHEELLYGRVEPASRRYFQAVIRRLERRGCQAVVLGCTEIPLLIGESDSHLPVLDSSRLLARAALREATRDLSA